jgi:hypothetical protein
MRGGFVISAMLALVSPALARPAPALASPALEPTSSQQSFSPSLEVTAETSATDTPTGLEMNLRVPQSEDPNGPAEEQVKNAVVTLPPGLSLSPSANGGLEACSPAQVGIGSAQESERPPACPAASQVGNLEVSAPQFEHPLEGEIYLAQQETVHGALVGVYLVVDAPATGIPIKLVAYLELGGETNSNPALRGLEPGQVRVVFDNSPQLPFSDLKLVLSGGPRALFVSPQTCGSAGASSEITGWNGAVATPVSKVFSTRSGCSEGFAPAFTAGTTDNQAGAYSPFTLTISRPDGSQRLGAIEVTTPPGFSGDIAGVTICPNADLESAERRDRPGGGALEQANPSCPAGSDVGTVTATLGAGPDSVSATGQEYLAGPYKGAPFDLVAITPAISGPFDLGVVVLRQGLYIDPHTAQATVKSDPIPTVIDGVPIDVRSVTVKIDRPGFTFNPTNCDLLAVTGALTSTSGTSAPISSPFQVAGCQTLEFKPAFAASTAGKDSKADGASLHVDLTFPAAPQGASANIKSIKVDLPKQLPARLTTLQKACLSATFEANPASCPATSLVGSVKAITPILNGPLAGPVYLVSHGNEAFPDVVMVLQGQGITLNLVANTKVKDGITSNTFKTLPDAPVSSVEVTLPQGPYSALAANGSGSTGFELCGQTLGMPTAIDAQNGAVLKQLTKVTVTGCPKPKKGLTREQKLRKALKHCRRKHGKARASCEKWARHAYGRRKALKSPGRRRRA